MGSRFSCDLARTKSNPPVCGAIFGDAGNPCAEQGRVLRLAESEEAPRHLDAHLFYLRRGIPAL